MKAAGPGPAGDAARIATDLAAYSRSRRVGTIASGLVVTGAVTFAIGRTLVTGAATDRGALLVVLLWGPLTAAALVSLSLTASAPELESTAARRMRAPLAALMSALVALSALLLLPTALLDGTTEGAVLLLRNLGGAVGLTLLAAAAVGGPTAWSVPLLYALAVNSLGANTGGVAPLWAWPLRKAQDRAALLTAATLLVSGAAATLVRHVRIAQPADHGPD